MGYFSNGSEGEYYKSHYCFNCVNYNDKDNVGRGCAIWDLHLLHSYDLCNSKSKAKKIIDFLIPIQKCTNLKCKMFLKKTSDNTDKELK